MGQEIGNPRHRGAGRPKHKAKSVYSHDYHSINFFCFPISEHKNYNIQNCNFSHYMGVKLGLSS
jgi:hypothetical protein